MNTEKYSFIKTVEKPCRPKIALKLHIGFFALTAAIGAISKYGMQGIVKETLTCWVSGGVLYQSTLSSIPEGTRDTLSTIKKQAIKTYGEDETELLLMQRPR